MKTEGVSIVICCHNGSNRLPETIRHIARQRVPPYIAWELVIIDNGSSDNSADVARLEWNKHRVESELRVIAEPLLGLSHARARGFAEAQYEYVILCDDDNWLDENCVAIVYQVLTESPNIGALGGFGKLIYEAELPAPELSCIFAAGPQGPSTGRASGSKLYGAGCAIRHSAYQKLLGSGFKSLLIDRKGAELSSGGDYELCLALAILGYDIWYDERLRFTHFITRERLTWPYFKRYAYESSKCFNVLTSYKWVATDAPINAMPRVLMLRNFLVCLKIFLSVNAKRLISRQDAVKNALYFHHLVFKYKLLTYFSQFHEMVDTHKRIMKFRNNCRPSQHVLKHVVRKEYSPSLKLSFFSKPSRPLQ